MTSSGSEQVQVQVCVCVCTCVVCGVRVCVRVCVCARACVHMVYCRDLSLTNITKDSLDSYALHKLTALQDL